MKTFRCMEQAGVNDLLCTLQKNPSLSHYRMLLLEGLPIIKFDTSIDQKVFEFTRTFRRGFMARLLDDPK